MNRRCDKAEACDRDHLPPFAYQRAELVEINPLCYCIRKIRVNQVRYKFIKFDATENH
jgi:hypothetical protein